MNGPPPLQVLVIDGTREVRESLAEALATRGITTSLAPDGETALLMIGEHPPDLIILNAVLHLLSGVRLARTIRHRYPNLPIIGMSGSDREHREKMLAAGASSFLRKPISIPDLLQTIESLATH